MNGKLRFLLVIGCMTTGYILLHYSCAAAKLPVERVVDTLTLNTSANGDRLELKFMKGSSHNHPLMAFWMEDTAGNYIQSLYVAKSIGKGEFAHGSNKSGVWEEGPVRRPAALPVWSHSRGVQESDGLFIPTVDTPIPDAYTSATPPSNFVLRVRTDNPLPEKFNLFFEINQTWDWNEYWTNSKYPDDEDYKTSCQPALVYSCLVSRYSLKNETNFELVGHSHYSGEDGELYKDLSTFTTAKNIAESISVRMLD